MLLKVSLLCLATAGLGLGARLASRGDTPALPYDPNTSKYCDYWVDITSANTKCSSLPGQWGITLADFLRWVCSMVFYTLLASATLLTWNHRTLLLPLTAAPSPLGSRTA